MKKRFLLLFMLVLSLIFVACSPKTKNKDEQKNTKQTEQKEEKKEEKKTGKKTVTTTTSFLYDMVNILVGDKVEKQLVIPYGEDPHTYVATPEDLNKLKNADLVLYHGLHFEGKIVEALEKYGVAVAKDFPTNEILTMDEEDGSKVQDPHFWFDLNLYKKALNAAKDQLVKLLPEDKDSIEKNYKDYLGKLDELDKYIKDKLAQIPSESRYLVTPHDAFQYFSRSYKIQVMAPQGVSTDSEVSNSEIEKTAEFIASHKIKAIFAESTTNPERMKKLQEVVKSKGFEVKVVSGEGKELYSDSLAPEGKANTFTEMYKHNIDLIVDNLK